MVANDFEFPISHEQILARLPCRPPVRWVAVLAWADDPGSKVVKSTLTLEPEIDCPSCEDGIKHALVTAHGVQSADIDMLTNRIVIRYNPASIKLQALIGRIRVFGYTATEVK